jgi:hypothetical protein
MAEGPATGPTDHTNSDTAVAGLGGGLGGVVSSGAVGRAAPAARAQPQASQGAVA